jgi:hypothetical protein
MLRAFDSVAESRDDRPAVVTLALPTIYWVVVLSAVSVLIFVSSSMERTGFRSTILAAQMAVIGAFIGFLFIQDQPFKGTMAVTPAAVEHSIELMKARRI